MSVSYAVAVEHVAYEHSIGTTNREICASMQIPWRAGMTGNDLTVAVANKWLALMRVGQSYKCDGR